MPNNTIATNLQRLVDAKSDIADAITTMGGTVNQGDGFEEFPADIASIPSGANPLKYGAIPVLAADNLTWNSLNWSGYSARYGYNIWTLNGVPYHSGGSTQEYLDKTVNQWKTKTWNGLSSFYGDDVWTDGDSIYYSNGSDQYILNESTSTWNVKTWNGDLTSFYGKNIWTNNGVIRCPDTINDKCYYLDKSTSSWIESVYEKAFPGNFIWTDGNNIFYSNGSNQYVFDPSVFSKWTSKTWSGDLTSFSGSNVWTDGKNVFYSGGSNKQYVYIRSKWITLSSSPYDYVPSNSIGNRFWTDGEFLYYSASSSERYKAVLNTPSKLQIHCRP